MQEKGLYKFPRIVENVLQARDAAFDAIVPPALREIIIEKLSEAIFGPNQYDNRIRQALPHALRPTADEIARGVASISRSGYPSVPQPIDIKPYQGHRINPEFAAKRYLIFDPLAFSKNYPVK